MTDVSLLEEHYQQHAANTEQWLKRQAEHNELQCLRKSNLPWVLVP